MPGSGCCAQCCNGVLDAVLRQAAFHISKHSKDAEAVCGMFDRACKETRQAAQRAIDELKQNLKEESTRIAFDGKATAKERNAYVAAYGCVAWTDAALAAASLLADLEHLASCDAFVGTWEATLSRLAILNLAARAGSLPPFIWLDAPNDRRAWGPRRGRLRLPGSDG